MLSKITKSVLLLCGLALLLLLAPGLLYAQELQGELGGQVGSMAVEAARTVVLEALPQMTTAPTVAMPNGFRSVGPYAGVSDEVYKARKAQAAMLRMAMAPTLAPMPPPAQIPESGIFTPGSSKNYEGINQTCSNLVPADAGIAVSQFFGFQIVNSCVIVFNKNTGAVYAGYPKSINAFFGLSASAFTFDPRVIFDWVLRRFIVISLYADFANSRGFVMLAASANDDPRGTWYTYQIQGGGNGTCPDFPRLGQNYYTDPGTGALALSFNLFPCNANGFYGSLVDDQVWFIPKASIYSGGGYSLAIFNLPTYGGILIDSIQPVNVQSRSDKPRAIFGVSTFNVNFGGGQCSVAPGCNGLVVWAWSNVLPRSGSPGLQWSGVVISTPSNYNLPPNASQPGGPNTVASNDPRISSTVYYQAGTMWAVTVTNNGQGNPGLLAWQIRPTLADRPADKDPCTATPVQGWCPVVTAATVEQEIGYDIGTSAFGAYFGAITPDPERNIVMVFNFSGTNYYPSTAYVANRVTQAWGVWHDSGTFLRNGMAYYPYYRWGDYTAGTNDILDPVTGSGSTTPGIWFMGMYSRSDGRWGTAIGRVGYVEGNQP